MTAERKSGIGTARSPSGPGGESPDSQAFPWLFGQKITIPDRVVGYVHRAELVDRAMPTRRHLTVLKAAGGFGKTTLLAECCRKLRREGVAAAWVSLDERDEPAVLDTYIAMACQSAGLDLQNVSDLEGTGGGPESRIGVVAREIQASGKPFVIAFDELERLENPASVSLLEFLLQRGPSNLHLAMACRRIPDGLNVAGAVLDGRARLVTTEELRFSKVPCGRIFRPGVIARRAGRRDETFPGMAVCLAHLPQPDAARQRWGRGCRSGRHRELDRVEAVRGPWRR